MKVHVIKQVKSNKFKSEQGRSNICYHSNHHQLVSASTILVELMSDVGLWHCILIGHLFLRSFVFCYIYRYYQATMNHFCTNPSFHNLNSISTAISLSEMTLHCTLLNRYSSWRPDTSEVRILSVIFKQLVRHVYQMLSFTLSSFRTPVTFWDAC